MLLTPNHVDRNLSTHGQVPVGMHLPSLFVALIIMLTGSIYPFIMARADGTAHHALALSIFWAMSAGLVRGVGFVPRARVWRLLFSGWSCFAALLMAVLLWWDH